MNINNIIPDYSDDEQYDGIILPIRKKHDMINSCDQIMSWIWWHHKMFHLLLDSGDRFEGGMTTQKHAGMTKCSAVTASRDLADLVDKNILLKRPGGGRSTSYELSVITELKD